VFFHISEDAGIERFDPRPSEYTAEPVVWSIDADRLRGHGHLRLRVDHAQHRYEWEAGAPMYI
jgi:hypothetical protein